MEVSKFAVAAAAAPASLVCTPQFDIQLVHKATLPFTLTSKKVLAYFEPKSILFGSK